MVRFYSLIFLGFFLTSCASSHGVKPDEYFNKPAFDYLEFAKEARACGRDANARVAKEHVSAPGGGGLIGAFAVGVVSGVSKSQKRRDYIMTCMQSKGYVIESIGVEERAKRIAYVEDYAKKERAEFKITKNKQRSNTDETTKSLEQKGEPEQPLVYQDLSDDSSYSSAVIKDYDADEINNVE